MTPLPLQITCKEFAELVTAYEDGVLPEWDRIRFVPHSERCPGCRAYLQQLRLTVEALRSVPPETAEPENLNELARRFTEQEPPQRPESRPVSHPGKGLGGRGTQQ
jgi:hypothetical protein